MKLVFALVIAVILLMVMAPVALAADTGVTVYVSVSVDGKLLVAAQPVTVTNLTVDGAVKAAHVAYYSGGESGYTAGIDPTFNMYLITKCWGIQATPFVILNGAPLGADPTKVPPTADAAPVAANDNIIICTSSDAMNKPATPVSLTSTLSGDSATLTATSWTLDFTTFTYSHVPLANAKVVDSKGASLGTTDADGKITVTVPADGIVAIDGLAAINVKVTPSAPVGTTTAPAGGGLSYKDAKQHIGETVTIQDKVYEKTDAGDFWVLYLGGPSTDPDAVGIEVAKSDVSKFPADLYVGKTISITGALHSNPVGGASFSLTDLSQVQEGGVSTSAPASATPTFGPGGIPAATELPIMHENSIFLIIWGVIILIPTLTIVIVKIVRQSRSDKPAASQNKKSKKDYIPM